jgi:uncharacterized membrane protein (UPF0127 family)
VNISSLVLGTDRRLPSLVGRLALGLMALALAAAAPGDVRLRTEPLSIATAKGVARFTVEIADTDATRERGLMFRKSLGPHEGMLFDFQTPQSVSFWMKNTYIPLDMVFIAADGRIVSIARNAVPFDESPIPSGGAVTGVLEIRGGRAAEIGAEPGDLVTARMFHR